MASTPGVNSAFQRYVIFRRKFCHFKNYWDWGGGGEGGTPSISAFYSVKLCIIETRIHSTLLHRGSFDLTPIFLFQVFGNCYNVFASLTSFSLPTLVIKCGNLPVSLISFFNFPDSIHCIMSFSEELIKELFFFSVVRFFPSLVCQYS